MTTSKAAASSVSPTALIAGVAAYHNSIVNALDGIAVKTEVDAELAQRFATFAGTTFTPPNERKQVIDSLERLRSRTVAAKTSNDVATCHAIDKAIQQIEAQPEKMPAQNGHDQAAHVDPAAATQHDQPVQHA